MSHSSTQNINDSFFAGMYKDVWKKLMHPGLTKAETEFILEIAQLNPTDKVLDLMCGYGRHSLELARNGISVKAVDNEPDYIREVKLDAKNSALPVEAIASDVMTTDFGSNHKAVICMGNSFAFFNKETATVLLKKISGALADDGIVIISSWMVAEIALKHFKEKDWMQVDEYKYLLSYKYHPAPSRIESEHTLIREDGAREVIRGVDYIFTLGELEEMLNRAGLTTTNLFSTPRKKKFALGDSTVYIVAEKLKR